MMPTSRPACLAHGHGHALFALILASAAACSNGKRGQPEQRAAEQGQTGEASSQARDAGRATPESGQPADPAKSDAMPQRMRCLVESYPQHLCGGDANHVYWCDGTVMLWDDGREKADHDTLLDTADLEDQMSQPYRPGREYDVPIPVDWEPGRIRHTPFFMKMYGETESEVRATLIHISWLPGSVNRRVRVTKVNGVDDKLAAVARDIEALPRQLVASVEQTSGPFYWRDIKGTTRKSMHSFAVAFDVGLDHAYYWRWSKPDARGHYPYKNAMPLEIVEVFEKHGFIWGGKWYHYDSPHFEYRPELLHPACVAPTK
jgi:peptidoglycan L-alanyl-D-glutamate endopeptidase CwlK